MAHEFLGDAAMGFKMAYCERNFAIYTTVLLAGCAFALWRSHWRPLSVRVFLWCLAPMALDGLAQLAGFHESTWKARSLTGALAGLAAVWLVYPPARPRAHPGTDRACFDARRDRRAVGWGVATVG